MDNNDKIKRLSKLQEKVDLIFKPMDCEKVLKKSLEKDPKLIIDEIMNSGLRGRGGAGFPTGMKWQWASEEAGDEKYVICNADEGEPGTFKDRMILEDDVDKVILGMAICAHCIGAFQGIIYLRGEYNYLKKELEAFCAKWTKTCKDMGLSFNVRVQSGSGAYICGEETALIESLEGNRGEPRNKPPFPIKNGYLGKPTVVNNVETLAYAAIIMNEGAKKFSSIGSKDSAGAKVFSISGDTFQNGVYELPLGMNLQEFVDIFGDGDTKAVQVGGSSGSCIPRKDFASTIIGFDGVPTGGSMILFNSTRSMYHVLKNFLEFFEEESCGQCTPCRVGCQQLLKGIEAIRNGKKKTSYLDDLQSLAQVMFISSKCGLGQSLANPFNSITRNFRDEICF